MNVETHSMVCHTTSARLRYIDRSKDIVSHVTTHSRKRQPLVEVGPYIKCEGFRNQDAEPLHLPEEASAQPGNV